AAVGMFLDDLTSTVKIHRGLVVDNQSPGLVGAETVSPVLFSQALEHLDSCFNASFRVVGATLADQNRISLQVPITRLLPDSLIWHIHISGEPKTIRSPKYTPIVGFHSYGNQYRWPSSEKAFCSAYKSTKFKTRFYGNIQPVRKKFGDEVFEQTDIVNCYLETEEEFLASLDFWVYYPNERLRDRLWPPVLRAMLAGKVVILPDSLQPIYGDAAVYADAENVSDVVLTLSKDTEAYSVQALRGQDFVKKNHSSDRLYWRIQALSHEDV